MYGFIYSYVIHVRVGWRGLRGPQAYRADPRPLGRCGFGGHCGGHERELRLHFRFRLRHHSRTCVWFLHEERALVTWERALQRRHSAREHFGAGRRVQPVLHAHSARLRVRSGPSMFFIHLIFLRTSIPAASLVCAFLRSFARAMKSSPKWNFLRFIQLPLSCILLKFF